MVSMQCVRVCVNPRRCMCIHESVCCGINCVSNRTKAAKPRWKQSDLVDYEATRNITPSVMEDTFQDKSNKLNNADFHDKRCPGGLLKGAHYTNNSDGALCVCWCAHINKLVSYSSGHPLIFSVFWLFYSMLPASVCLWKTSTCSKVHVTNAM